MTVDTPRVVRALGVVAGLLGLAAIFAGNPIAARGASARASDRVSAIDLAAWIKARRSGLRIVDLRTATEFDEYHVPTAESIPFDSLSRTNFDSDATIVLYGNGVTRTAQARDSLRALGRKNVLVLRDGVNEWLDGVMNPTLAVDAPAADSVRFVDIAQLSRYFGGAPERRAKNVMDKSLLRRVRRRGC